MSLVSAVCAPVLALGLPSGSLRGAVNNNLYTSFARGSLGSLAIAAGATMRTRMHAALNLQLSFRDI